MTKAIFTSKIEPSYDDLPEQLSGTVHWMFDRGLVSVDDDFSILIAKDRLPEAVIRMLREDRKLAVPLRQEQRPHPVHLSYHRKIVFKG